MNQLSIEFARAARDEGMQLAADHADAVVNQWTATAYAFVCRFVKEHPEFTSYELRLAADEWGLLPPPTPKAYGPVLKRAAKAGLICKAGYRPHPERHASPTVLWRAA